MRIALWMMIALMVVVIVRVTREPAPSRSDAAVHRALSETMRDGLLLRADVVQAHGAIAVEARVENRRSRSVWLARGKCGLVTSALMQPTAALREGRRWPGSIGRLKRMVVGDDRLRPDPFTRRPLNGGTGPSPPCRQARGAVRLRPGAMVRERWELIGGSLLHLLGSRGTAIEVGTAVAGGPSLSLRTPASTVIDSPPSAEPSQGRQFDRLMRDRRLRSWISARPASSWRDARLIGGRLRVLVAGHGRPLAATLGDNGPPERISVPGPRDIARPFPSRAPELPAGIRVVPEPEGARPTRDVIAGRVLLPSGRLVVGADGFFGGDDAEKRVTPGRDQVRLTLARSPRGGGERVALATLVVSHRPTVTWRRTGGVGTDGGTAGGRPTRFVLDFLLMHLAWPH